jgi:hypothetical protein
MVLEIGHFGKWIRITWKILNCGAGRMEKKSWNGRVKKNKEVLHRVEEESNILHTIKRRQANWIGHIWRCNCLLEHVIERKTERKVSR